MSTARGSDAIVVTGVGAVSPIGHTAPIGYTSLRAGLARVGDSGDIRARDSRGKLVHLACGSVAGITDGHRRFLRLFRMTLPALSEAIASAGLDAAMVEASTVHLALAETARPGMDDRAETGLIAKLCRHLRLPDASARTRISMIGHAGAYEGLAAAIEAIAGGHSTRAIVGAVDTYLDEVTLEWLKDVARLKSDENPKGFVPGEAAAFIVIERLSTALARGASVLAEVASCATAVEENSVYEKTACTGTGLTTVLRRVLAASDSTGSIGVVMCDLNGERYRANEWGLALSRSFGADPIQASLLHPADCMGDAGAATGALNLAYGSLAVARGHAGGAHLLAWGSSDDGQRGAAVLAAAPGNVALRREVSWA